MKKLIVSVALLGLCTLASQNAFAQSNIGMKGWGVQVGMVSPESMDATLGFGAFADLGTMTPNRRLVPHLDYWGKSEDFPGGGTSSVGDVALSVRGKYMFPVSSPRVQPFAGAGLGIHMLHAKVEMPGFPDMTDSSTKLGFDFGGGVTSPMNPKTDFVGEAWYGVVDGFSQMSVKVGLAFKLGS